MPCHMKMVELGLLCSKNHAFNDHSVSPVYKASQEPHKIWYTGPTTHSFIIYLSLTLGVHCEFLVPPNAI